MKKKIEVIKAAGPSITKREITIVNDMMINGWDNYNYVEKFEKVFANYHGRKYGLMTPSCTMAIHLLLKSLMIKKNDEVIVPVTTWTASVAPIVSIGAKPIFVDIDKDNWCIDCEKIEKKINKKTKAILFVDLYGNFPNIEKLKSLTKKYKLFLIEDAAEALGSIYKGKFAGKFGVGSVHSFHRTKTITSGEGGFLLLDNYKIFKRAKFLRDLGRSYKDPYIANEISLKYMPSNLQASLVYGQFTRIKELLKIKKNIFINYINHLKKNNIKFTTNFSNKKIKNGYWATTIVYDSKYKIKSTKVVNLLNKVKVPARNFFSPLTTQKGYKKYAKKNEKFPIAASNYNRGLTLPCHYKLNKNQIVYICDQLSKILKKS